MKRALAQTQARGFHGRGLAAAYRFFRADVFFLSFLAAFTDTGLADVLAFVAFPAACRDFFEPPKMFSQPAAYRPELPTRMTDMT
jgi:hypothetical protein